MNQEDSTDQKFEQITRSYLEAWFRYHPEAAVEVGFSGYEHLLTPYADEETGALVCLNDELLVSLDEIGKDRLSPDRQIDFQLLYGAALLENQRLLDIDPNRRDPERIVPVNAIYQLTIRPVADFADALMARLSAIPEYLQGGRDFLHAKAKGIPPLWLESAVISARRGADFLRGLAADPTVARRGRIPGLEAAAAKAADACAGLADFLDRDLAAQAEGEFACGARYFEHLLSYRHFLEADCGQVRALGEDLFEQTRRDLRDACRGLVGTDDPAAAMRRIRAAHPQADRLLSTYREQMQAARDFVRTHDLVSLPAREQLDVVETPVFLRHQVPFAAYMEPQPDDPEQHGYYYVTPPQDAEQLAEHDCAGLMHTCVHEAWPGHHLQFVTANLSPVSRSLPRLLNPSATMYEGWALYSEQLMHEQGFLDRPEQRFILLRDRLWRALRVIVDIDLHTRGLALENAADLMVSHLGFPRSQALADLTWYTRSPAVPLGYATGWALINALRDRLRAEERTFELRGFHDRLLSAGSIALPLVIRRVFGSNRWSSVRGMVFSDVSYETA